MIGGNDEREQTLHQLLKKMDALRAIPYRHDYLGGDQPSEPVIIRKIREYMEEKCYVKKHESEKQFVT